MIATVTSTTTSQSPALRHPYQWFLSRDGIGMAQTIFKKRKTGRVGKNKKQKERKTKNSPGGVRTHGIRITQMCVIQVTVT
jgi:hypothetical protein